MSKLKITQKQYDLIILHERDYRLNAVTSLLNENLDQSTELLEEGWREVVLGIAMMLGVGLTGHNKLMAQDAVKNQETMSQIKSTLEDEDKLGELVDALKSKGFKNPEAALSTNAEKVSDAFNRVSKNNKLGYKVDVKVVNNLQGLSGKLRQGYSLKNIETTTDTVPNENQEIVTILDTMEINLGSDNLFVTGGYTLSQGGVDTLKMTIDAIEKQGGVIKSVDIESSTDAERITKFISKDDVTGNIKLANLRSQSISNELNSLGVNTDITHREIPNNGSDVVSTKEFSNAAKNTELITALRDKTVNFRYVKLKIVVLFESKVVDKQEPPANIIKNYRFELVKVIESIGKTQDISSKTHFKNKKIKCNRSKGKTPKSVSCSTFGG